MKTLHQEDIEKFDTRYEQLAREVHLKYKKTLFVPEDFLSDMVDVAYEALVLLGMRKTADILVAGSNDPQVMNPSD
jgi:hypothetical protein